MGSGSLVNLAGGAVSALATFALAWVLTRALPAADAGLVFSLTSLFLLVTAVGQLGASTGLVYFVARADLFDRSTLPAYLRAAALPLVTVATTVALLAALLAPRLAGWVGARDGSAAVPALRVLAVFVLCAGLLELFTSATRGLGSMAPTSVIDQVARPVLQLALVAAVVPTGRVDLVVVAWVLPYLPAAVVAQLWWRRLRPAPLPAVGPPSRVWPAYWRFTGPRVLAGVAQVAMQRLDIVLVGALAGLRAAAVYAAVTRFVVAGQVAGTAFARAVQPRLAGALTRGDRSAAQEMYRTATCWLVLLTWPLYLVLLAGAPWIVGTVFGDGYADGAGALRLLSLAMLIATGCGMVDIVLTMGGRTGWNLANVVLAFAVNLGLDLWLVPRHGLWGAAIGWAVAILCANLVPLAQVRAYVRLDPFGRGTLTAMALAGLCFGVVPLTARLALASGPGTALLGSLASLPAYAVACWWLRSWLRIGPIRSPARMSEARAPVG
jgi:O-antigen/teichoic acid export membrane protein